MDGILLINKPKDWTSRDICNKVSHILHTKKVGHSGTLDPFATGLLLVAVGNATKTLPYCDNSTKTYEAKLLLGKKSSTGDLTGEIINEKTPHKLEEKDIVKTLETFLGKQQQIPPMTSAIHVNGKKLYELAHKGIEVERKSRPIEIFSLELIDYADDIITFKCTVSSGTYIRTLGEDIAEKLGEIGHLISLNRIQIGNHNLTDAITIEDDLANHLKDPSDFICVPKVIIDESVVTDVMNGKRISINECYLEKILVVDKNNKAIAICEHEKDGIFKISRGLW